jgi:putative ABC transport system permease protein
MPAGTARAVTHPSTASIARRPRWIAVAALVLTVPAVVAVVMVSRGSAAGPWERTFEATDGPHVVVAALPGADLTALRSVPGLTAASGPFPVVDTSLRYRGREIGVRLEGRSDQATAVDHPLLVFGEWARRGMIVLERSTARALGVPTGGDVSVATTRGRVGLTLSGIAETAAPSRSSGTARGLGYVVPGTLSEVAPHSTYGSTMLLRLADPESAGKYADWIRQRYPGGQAAVAEPSPSR